MRENRPSGSEGGAILIPSSLPLSIIQFLRDIRRRVCDLIDGPLPPLQNSTTPSLRSTGLEDEDDDEYEGDFGASHILKQLHEAEVHVELLVAVEQS